MTGRQCRRGVLPGALAVILTLAACGDSNPHGLAFVDFGRATAGIYRPAISASNLNMRLAIGTRHTLTGRYETSSGEVVRFEGTWQREAFTLFLSFPQQQGLPAELVLEIRRETILTKIEPGPFSMQPENQPLFLENKIVRLRGAVVIAGVPLDLNLVRVITDVVGAGGGGQTAASVLPR